MNKILLTKLIFVLALAPNLMGSSSSPSAQARLELVQSRRALAQGNRFEALRRLYQSKRKANEISGEIEAQSSSPMSCPAPVESSSSSSSSSPSPSPTPQAKAKRPAGSIFDPNLKTGCQAFNAGGYEKAKVYFQKVISKGSDTWGIPLAKYYLGKMFTDPADSISGSLNHHQYLRMRRLGKQMLHEAVNQTINAHAKIRAQQVLAELENNEEEAPVPRPTSVPVSSSSSSSSIETKSTPKILATAISYRKKRLYKSAYELFQTVIKRGDDAQATVEAQYELGTLLMFGKGNSVEANPVLAKELLQKAAMHSTDPVVGEIARHAQNLLAKSQAIEPPTVVNAPVARPIIQTVTSSSSASSSSPSPSLFSSPLIEQPAAVSSDAEQPTRTIMGKALGYLRGRVYKTASELFQLVIKRGDDVHATAEAQYELGKLLMFGKGKSVAANRALAKELLQKAANSIDNVIARQAQSFLRTYEPATVNVPVAISSSSSSPSPMVPESAPRPLPSPVSIVAPISQAAPSAPMVPMIQPNEAIQRSVLPAPVCPPVAQDNWHGLAVNAPNQPMTHEQQRNMMLFMVALGMHSLMQQQPK